MRRILFLAPFTCLTFGAPLTSTPLPHGPPPYINNDHKLLVEAALDGSTAVELATIAVQKAASDAVKRFARQAIHGGRKVDVRTFGDFLQPIVGLSIVSGLGREYARRVLGGGTSCSNC